MIEQIELLPVFVEVVRQGSFTGAATQLGLPKSTISRRIAKLEGELGVELLARTTRKLRLTDAGSDLYEQVAPALAQLDDAARALAERQRTPQGTLRVTAPIDLGDGVAAYVVSSFVTRYPQVRVEMTLTNRVVDLAGEGFDAGIRAGRLSDRTDLVGRKLGTSSLGLFAAPRYLEERGVPERVADLAEHECVLFRAQGGTARWTLDGPNGRESVEVRGAITADDFTFVRGSVRAGAGIGLLPTVGLAMEGLTRVLPAHSTSGGAIYLVYPSTRHLPAKVAAFRDHVIEAFRSLPCNAHGEHGSVRSVSSVRSR